MTNFIRCVVAVFGVLMGMIAGREAAAKNPGFVSSLLGKPSDWSGAPEDLFKAHYDYPKQADDLSSQPWLTLDPRIVADRDAYFAAVLNYGLTSFTADIGAGCPAVQAGWYHAPWLTFSFGNTEEDLAAGRVGSGREPICGLTRERAAPKGFLHKKQTQQAQSWAVGAFNQPGGFLLGKVWRDQAVPDVSDMKFPNGAFVIKFLFTEAGIDQVPYLAGAPEWSANIYESVSSEVRKTKSMRLAQIDFGVRDARFDGTTGWVYGTFIYHNATGGATADWKANLVPVGLIWGNDPGKTASADFKEQVLTEKVLDLAKNGELFDLSRRTTFGWFNRVNGTLDNPMSSCLSCHGTAQVHKSENIKQFIVPALVPEAATDDNKMMWFRNVPAAGAFTFTPTELALIRQGDPSTLRADWTVPLMSEFVGTDYSLQLRMAIENARFFQLQTVMRSLDIASRRLPEPILTPGARDRFLQDAAREARRIERSGEFD